MYIQDAPKETVIVTVPSSPGSDTAVLSEKAIITELEKKINADATFATTILNALAAKTTESFVNNAIETLNIIGKNLISNSSDYGHLVLNLATVNSNTELNPHFGKNATSLNLHSGSFDCYRNISSLVIGNKYTISLFVKLGTATNFVITPGDGNDWNTYGIQTEVNTPGWNRIKISFVATNSNLNLHFGGNASAIVQTIGTVILYGLKLEIGDVATTYLED